MKTTVTTRDAGDVKIIELHGKITIGPAIFRCARPSTPPSQAARGSSSST